MKECIMLAAGLSSRMGDWKMLLPWQGSTVLDSALDNALAFCDRVILVTGFRAAELRQRYAGRSAIQLCHNARYQAGMFSSVRCGVAALTGDRFFVVPGDMPAIDAAIYAQLWRHQSCGCLLPSYAGRNGHPVLLPFALAAYIAAAPEESNLRALIRACGYTSVPVESQAIHWDIDTPEQYRQRVNAVC